MLRCEIPHERWPQSLDQFSRLHTGRTAHVSTSGAVAGGANADDLPLIGITIGAGSPSGEDEVRIMVGRPHGPHLDHVLPRPRRLWKAEWNDGVSGMLEFDSDDGSTTLVQVGPPEQVLPEGMIIDGVPPKR
jgi:hypothetical protein